MACEQSYFLPTSIDVGLNATKADRLRRKPDTFRRLTGITPEDFDQVMEDLRPLYEEAEKERLSRPDRERAIGGGAQFQARPGRSAVDAFDALPALHHPRIFRVPLRA